MDGRFAGMHSCGQGDVGGPGRWLESGGLRCGGFRRDGISGGGDAPNSYCGEGDHSAYGYNRGAMEPH